MSILTEITQIEPAKLGKHLVIILSENFAGKKLIRILVPSLKLLRLSGIVLANMFHPYRRLSRLRYERDLLILHGTSVDKNIQADDVAAPLIDVPTVPSAPTTENLQDDIPFFETEPALSDVDSDQEANETTRNVELGKLV